MVEGEVHVTGAVDHQSAGRLGRRRGDRQADHGLHLVRGGHRGRRRNRGGHFGLGFGRGGRRRPAVPARGDGQHHEDQESLGHGGMITQARLLAA